MARRFIEAFNERDLETLLELVSDDVQLHELDGEVLQGGDHVQTLLATAEKFRLRLVPSRTPDTESDGATIHVQFPVRELIGRTDIEQIVEIDVRDSRVTAFAIRPSGQR